MNKIEVIQKIKECNKLMDEIPKKEFSTTDGDKEIEIHESFIVDLIINYCKENQYIKQQRYPFSIDEESDENDVNLSTFEQQLYYIDVLSLIHEDVFEMLCEKNKNYWAEFINKEKLIAIAESISFTLRNN